MTCQFATHYLASSSNVTTQLYSKYIFTFFTGFVPADTVWLISLPFWLHGWNFSIRISRDRLNFPPSSYLNVIDLVEIGGCRGPFYFSEWKRQGPVITCLTHGPLGDLIYIFDKIFQANFLLMDEVSHLILCPDEWQLTVLLISQHWFRQLLGTTKRVFSVKINV